VYQDREDSVMHTTQREPSLGELFGDLSRQLTTLVRQEMHLATTEMKQKASGMGRDVGLMAAGGLLAYVGVLGIVAGIILWLGLVIPLWLSALIVGAVIVVLGFLLVRSGLAGLKQRDLAPQATIRSLREDVEWAKEAAA